MGYLSLTMGTAGVISSTLRQGFEGRRRVKEEFLRAF